MSEIDRTEACSRRLLTVAAAVIAAALMLAVPILTAADTDADSIKDASAGYTIKMDNPRDSDLAPYVTYTGDMNKSQNIETSCNIIFMKVFNTDVLVPDVKSQTYVATYANGVKLTSQTATEFTDDEMSAEGIEMTYTFTGDGDLVNSDAALNSELTQVVDAIKGLFGNEVKNGDQLKITGKVKLKYAWEDTLNFIAVDDTHSVYKDGTERMFYVADVDVSIEFIKSGASAGKIYYRADDKYMAESKITYDYDGVDYSALTPLSPCTVKYSPATFSEESGSAYYSVSGTDYRIGHTSTSVEFDGTADVRANTDWNLNDYQTWVDSIPTASGDGKVTVSKSYDDARSEFASTEADVLANDILAFILVIVGVVVAIIVLTIILVIVLLVLRKKKRQ